MPQNPKNKKRRRTDQIDQHTLKVLELNKLRAILATFAASQLGRTAAFALYPSTNLNWITDRLAETSEIKQLIENNHRIPLAGIRDIRSLQPNIATLDPETLLDIRDTLQAAENLRNFASQISYDIPHFRRLTESLDDFTETIAEITRCIDPEKFVRDQASPKLHELRRRIQSLNSLIRRHFHAIVSSPKLADAIENDNFLTRNHRPVIAVKENYRSWIPGVVLDRSKSGSTLFVEPHELAELGNELESAITAEHREVTRILSELTRLIIRQRPEILNTVRILGLIDLAHAKAKYSLAWNMSCPEIDPQNRLRLRDARHPLLLELCRKQSDSTLSDIFQKIIPLDVRLGEDFDLLLLTGPNTGGKTVTLKTIGLITLMAQAGMHIPASSGSTVPVYQKIFADIGDEQSLQQSLSTFSSHMKHIVRILENANEKSLILLDELGSGTDPSEGAALGTAILDALVNASASVVATTHLGKLKSYAWRTPRTINASLEFNLETLSPTFRLLIGNPGASNALAIARRLGMSKKIVNAARGQLDTDALEENELINQVQTARLAAEQSRSQAESTLDEINALQQQARDALELAKRERKDAAEQANQIIERTMSQVRRLTTAYLSNAQNAPKPFSEHAQEFAKKIHQTAAATPLRVRQAQFVESVRKGDTVYAVRFRRTAEVIKIRNKQKTMILYLENKQVEVPFEDISEPAQ